MDIDQRIATTPWVPVWSLKAPERRRFRQPRQTQLRGGPFPETAQPYGNYQTYQCQFLFLPIFGGAADLVKSQLKESVKTILLMVQHLFKVRPRLGMTGQLLTFTQLGLSTAFGKFFYSSSGNRADVVIDHIANQLYMTVAESAVQPISNSVDAADGSFNTQIEDAAARLGGSDMVMALELDVEDILSVRHALINQRLNHGRFVILNVNVPVMHIFPRVDRPFVDALATELRAMMRRFYRHAITDHDQLKSAFSTGENQEIVSFKVLRITTLFLLTDRMEASSRVVEFESDSGLLLRWGVIVSNRLFNSLSARGLTNGGVLGTDDILDELEVLLPTAIELNPAEGVERPADRNAREHRNLQRELEAEVLTDFGQNVPVLHPTAEASARENRFINADIERVSKTQTAVYMQNMWSINLEGRFTETFKFLRYMVPPFIFARRASYRTSIIVYTDLFLRGRFTTAQLKGAWHVVVSDFGRTPRANSAWFKFVRFMMYMKYGLLMNFSLNYQISLLPDAALQRMLRNLWNRL